VDSHTNKTILGRFLFVLSGLASAVWDTVSSPMAKNRNVSWLEERPFVMVNDFTLVFGLDTQFVSLVPDRRQVLNMHSTVLLFRYYLGDDTQSATDF
jgi:hypothetical protein